MISKKDTSVAYTLPAVKTFLEICLKNNEPVMIVGATSFQALLIEEVQNFMLYIILQFHSIWHLTHSTLSIAWEI
jgi:hypothetical protein